MFAMRALAYTLLTTLVTAHANTRPWKKATDFGVSSSPSGQSYPETKSTINLPLTRKSTKSISHSLLRGMSSKSASQSPSNSTALTTVEDGQVFLTPITFGPESFLVVIDTGSSDTWLVRRGFSCISVATGMQQGQGECAFGPQYVKSSTFIEIPDQNFNVSYGDGEFLRGIMGLEEVCLSNLTVASQEVGAVDYAAWNGDGQSSGILGLAFPSLTSAWGGDEQDAGEDSESEEYQPLFMNMMAQRLVKDAIFTLAISRDEGSGGFLTLGGLPDQSDVSYVDKFSKVPIEVMKASEMGYNLTGPEYTFYAIDVDGFPNPNTSPSDSSSGSTKPKSPKWPNITNVQAVVDSGTTLIYLPNPVSNAINRIFATYDPTGGTWYADCNATAPSWDLIIGGQSFSIDPRDMIVENSDGVCLSGVQDAFNGFAILGDVFLKNVLAVFDVGNLEMRFAQKL